jgi:DNA-binding MarR family transcriptional regulator
VNGLAEETRYLILALQREGNRLLAQALAPANITPSQAEVISLLFRTPGLTVKGLGERLVCESGDNPSRLIDRLVVRGLVLRTTSEKDKRAVTLSLTPEGAGLYTQLIEPVENGLHSFVERSLPEGELKQLHSLLSKFATATGAGDAVFARRG